GPARWSASAYCPPGGEPTASPLPAPLPATLLPPLALGREKRSRASVVLQQLLVEQPVEAAVRDQRLVQDGIRRRRAREPHGDHPGATPGIHADRARAGQGRQPLLAVNTQTTRRQLDL